MLTGSLRRRLCLSGLGDETIDTVSAFPFKLLIEGFPMTTDGDELEI